jgi:hypothetical protein
LAFESTLLIKKETESQNPDRFEVQLRHFRREEEGWVIVVLYQRFGCLPVAKVPTTERVEQPKEILKVITCLLAYSIFNYLKGRWNFLFLN